MKYPLEQSSKQSTMKRKFDVTLKYIDLNDTSNWVFHMTLV